MRKVKFFRIFVNYAFKIPSVEVYYTMPAYTDNEYWAERLAMLKEAPYNEVIAAEYILERNRWVEIELIDHFPSNYYIVKALTLEDAYRTIRKFIREVKKCKK